MTNPYLAAALAAVVILFAPRPAAAHDDDVPSGKPEVIGKVHFPVSCNEAAQREFDRAVALYHSFWFDPANESYKKVLALDPTCGMAAWGLALSALGNPFAWPAPAKAMQAGAGYIKKSATGRRPQRAREGLHRCAFRLVCELANHRTQAVRARLGAIDGESRSDHPGVAHYLIHAYDYTAIVEKGLPAARRYASIAPSAPHALHMPAHIFNRLGLWEDSIQTNSASVRAAKAELKSTSLSLCSYNALHAMDYMMYAYLQRAQDTAAHELIEEASAIQKLDAAAADIERLRHLQTDMQKMKLGYWAQQAEIQITAASAWLAFGEGRKDEALAAMQKAVDLETNSDKHPVTPGPLVPARELLGEMLLEMNKPAAALSEFSRETATEPNRYRAIANAARAAELSGDMQMARALADQLLQLTAKHDTERPELGQAKVLLSM